MSLQPKACGELKLRFVYNPFLDVQLEAQRLSVPQKNERCHTFSGKMEHINTEKVTAHPNCILLPVFV